MSDRTNRDIGNKRNHQKNKRECSCWYCISGKEKKRLLRDKEAKQYKNPVDNL